MQNEPLTFPQSIKTQKHLVQPGGRQGLRTRKHMAAARQVQEDVTVPGKVLFAACLSFPTSEMGLTGAPAKGTETTSSKWFCQHGRCCYPDTESPSSGAPEACPGPSHPLVTFHCRGGGITSGWGLCGPAREQGKIPHYFTK